MPELIRGVARTAVIAGTATAVSNRVSRRQAQRWAAQGPQAAYDKQPYEEPHEKEAPPAPSRREPTEPSSTEPSSTEASSTEVLAQLEKLGALRDSGVLTEEEFAAQKARILRV
jgi:hypothetical protein